MSRTPSGGDTLEAVPPKKQKRRRVLLKLSGEAFGGGSLGVNPDIVGSIAREIAEAAPKGSQDKSGVEIAVGQRLARVGSRGIDRQQQLAELAQRVPVVCRCLRCLTDVAHHLDSLRQE